jgi:hypothetical protein
MRFSLVLVKSAALSAFMGFYVNSQNGPPVGLVTFVVGYDFLWNQAHPCIRPSFQVQPHVSPHSHYLSGPSRFKYSDLYCEAIIRHLEIERQGKLIVPLMLSRSM